MSLGKTLLKVAIGVAVIKGMSSLAKGGFGGTSAEVPGTAKRDGRLGDVMGDVLGEGRGRTRDSGGFGGSGDLLDQVMRDRPGVGSVPRVDRATGAGRGDAEGLGADTRRTRRTAPSDGLGGLLESILGGAAAGGMAPQEREAELAAAVGLSAIIQAVKADGALDADEKRKLMDHLGDASREEVAFVNAELARPVDVAALARQVPNGMEAQAYLASLMAINLDNQREADYLASLAEALELDPGEVNGLHDRAGAPRIFR